MFTKKQQTADIIKKSSLKVQDAKKDVFARLKHLKTVLGESVIISDILESSEIKTVEAFREVLTRNMIFA